MKVLLGPKNISIIENKTSYTSAKHAILEKFYPLSSKPQPMKEIGSIKQSKYYYIEDYYNSLESAVNRLAICSKWTENEKRIRMDEFFIENLHSKTHIRVGEIELTNSSEIKDMITRVENQIKFSRHSSSEPIK